MIDPKSLKLSYEHPPTDFGKVWLHLHRLGTPYLMDAYFKAWAFKGGKNKQTIFADYYPTKAEFQDLYLFFKEGNWYGKYNIKSFGYVMLDYFVDKEHFTEYLKKKSALKKEIHKAWQQYSNRKKIQKLTETELVDLVNFCQNLMVRSFVVDPFAPMIGEMAPDYTNWWLVKKNVPEVERKAAFQLLFASDKVSETIRRQLELKKAIDKVLQDPAKKEKLLKKLAVKYGYAKAEFNGYIPYSVEDVLKEYDAVSKIQLHTKEETAAKKALLKKLKASKQEKMIFYLFGYSQYSRDERKEYLQKLFTVADWALAELASKCSLSIDYLRSSLVGELSVEKLKEASYRNELERRYKEGIAMYFKDAGEGVYLTGKEGEALFNSIDNKANEQVTELKGQPTFYGKVRAKVKIVYDPHVEAPDYPFVLVTGMTSPDFIHLMQKCVAIVTDEGGITSHAAILSRELKKPCIVGTKIGRKILKDGDMVEVDAEKGIVTIIK